MESHTAFPLQNEAVHHIIIINILLPRQATPKCQDYLISLKSLQVFRINFAPVLGLAVDINHISSQWYDYPGIYIQ